MYSLISFGPGLDMPSHSPFCTKAMILLDMAGAGWVMHEENNPSKMPHGRLPVLKTQDRLIPDTHHIQSFLEGQGADFYEDCLDADKARGHMLTRMAEDSLRFGQIYDRWLNDACWDVVGPLFFAKVPSFMRMTVANSVRRNVRKGMNAQGIGQFSEVERVARLSRDLDAFEVELGDREWFLGDRATATDAAVLPVLHGIASLPADTALRRNLRARTTLMNYIKRGTEQLYPKAEMLAAA